MCHNIGKNTKEITTIIPLIVMNDVFPNSRKLFNFELKKILIQMFCKIIEFFYYSIYGIKYFD